VKRKDGYAPIGSYALLANGRGAALACEDGSIDWLAVPQVDTPPFLASVLDAPEGGFFKIAPVEDYEVSRRYVPGTMVLETTFTTARGSLQLTDAITSGFRGALPWFEVARKLEVRGGPVRVRFELRPGNRFSSVRPWVHLRDGTPFVLAGDLLAALILDGLGEPEIELRQVHGEAELAPGTTSLATLVLARGVPLYLPSPKEILRRLDHTIDSWKTWCELIDYSGPHEDVLKRSALVLKSLADSHTGAVVAAPTTSLPEVVGSKRNFDYRFGWVRDSSFMLDAMVRLGLTEEVDAALGWLLRCVRRTAPAIHVFYKIDGEPAPGDQKELSELQGYRCSAPVMLGNKAATQTQHGTYGDLFGAVSRHIENGARLDTDTAVMLAKLADQLCDEWPNPDSGIWELGEHRVYTSSLINCWTALDRAARLAEQGQIAGTHVERWKQAAAAIHAYADEHCWSEAKGSYTFYEGTDELDASVLLAARTGFLAPDDKRLWGTIDAIRRELTADGPLLYRYSGASEQEHAFVCCTFWLIEALCIAGRAEEAGPLLDGALKRANDLALFSEEIDARSGELLGNFPLGLSHLAVIGAITSYADARRSSGAA
jgi:GH15 family glucan-1,4-alpha-glucosidase